ncbi:gamma-glutamylcyclotransferase [Pseudoalteromonas citrea]|uniref:Gamma-glutamylcyclotransferase n=1 Tax=Pseudoalteromonas citrea TaxID=43655 RepID=A0A5S3XT48_9GAMM|nr:gamma-glutamylcyclotransferase family protein [Pseudoalteromonas citrea]TMP45096.1 gamma-glutamylcyclotransferase [Pseudoalteromonas citrea]TMP61522.1 gamma-glutamylcyclotransferase [Pseudoalteromonas citrea]
MRGITFYNFAFGSNMSSLRLFARLPQAKKVGVAQLSGFELKFSMLSTDGSAKCNIHQTSNTQDVVFGVVYALDECEQALLDEVEGARYDRTEVTVQLRSGEYVSAYCYIANTLITTQLPFDWYVQHVYAGALEHHFPTSYLARIKEQASVIDRQAQRKEAELSIYTK